MSCRTLWIFPKHDWGQWRDEGNYKEFNPLTGEQTGEFISQVRQCKKCGLKQTKRVSI